MISVDPSLKIRVEGAIQDFLVQKAAVDIIMEAKWSNLTSFVIKGKRLFDSGALWQLYHHDGEFLFSFTSSALGVNPYKVVRMKKDFSKGEVLLHREYFQTDQPVYPLEYPLDELLFTNFLALGRGAEVHACGVVDSLGRGHLFVGQSGAGKTTIAKLLQDESKAIVLSDDRIVLRKLGNKIWMYGTPWHGDAQLASPVGTPLHRVCFLARGEENQLIPQKSSQSIARLFSSSFLPFYNSAGLDFTLSFFEEVVKAVPCFELRFLPDKRVFRFLERLSGAVWVYSRCQKNSLPILGKSIDSQNRPFPENP